MQTPSKNRLWQRLFNKEFNMSDRHNKIALPIVIIFAITYAIAFLGLMPYIAYLGPGLGDDWNIQPFLQLLNDTWSYVDAQWHHPLWLFLIALITLNITFTAGIIICGYTFYPAAMGKTFPITILFTYLSLSAICTTGLGIIYLLIALIATILGYDFLAGLHAVSDLLQQIRTYSEQVPTLIAMPAFLAFIVLNMVGGFFHYWFHRLSHESRLIWLLFHRTHHMTPELMQPTTQAVFNSFPFFIVAVIPYVFIFSIIGKLMSDESLLHYLIVYKLLSAFSNMWSHQTALYQWAHQQKWIRVLSTITSEGVYHYLHHSAENTHNHKRGNLINIGGGLFFIWDRIFGTYVPLTSIQPRVGLQGIQASDMSSNPLRLALSGTAQILFELKHNRSVKSWLMILLGPSDYIPRHSKDYVLKEALIHR